MFILCGTDAIIIGVNLSKLAALEFFIVDFGYLFTKLKSTISKKTNYIF